MDIAFFRSSSYNAWDYCEQQYYLSYVLGIPQDVNAKAQKGTMFHKVMECLALGKLSLQTGQPMTDDVCGTIDQNKIYDIEYVYELLDKSFEHYRKHDPESFTEKDKKEIKKWISDYFNFNNGMFDPRKRVIFAAEQNFNFEIPDDWALLPDGNRLRLKGTIDLITKLGDKFIEVIDYKTGRRLDWATGQEKDLKKLQSDPQLMIYFYALKNLYPDYHILFTIFFVRDGGPFTLHFDDSVIQKVSGMLQERYLEIKSCKLPKMVHPTHNDFRCNKLCHYYKNNYEDTSISICDYIHRKIKTNGIDWVTKNMSASGHTVDSYKAPGE